MLRNRWFSLAIVYPVVLPIGAPSVVARESKDKVGDELERKLIKLNDEVLVESTRTGMKDVMVWSKYSI